MLPVKKTFFKVSENIRKAKMQMLKFKQILIYSINSSYYQDNEINKYCNLILSVV